MRKYYSAVADKERTQKRIKDTFGEAAIESKRAELCATCVRRQGNGCKEELLPITTGGVIVPTSR